jgi:hypothetical protein
VDNVPRSYQVPSVACVIDAEFGLLHGMDLKRELFQIAKERLSADPEAHMQLGICFDVFSAIVEIGHTHNHGHRKKALPILEVFQLTPSGYDQGYVEPGTPQGEYLDQPPQGGNFELVDSDSAECKRRIGELGLVEDKDEFRIHTADEQTVITEAIQHVARSIVACADEISVRQPGISVKIVIMN